MVGRYPQKEQGISVGPKIVLMKELSLKSKSGPPRCSLTSCLEMGSLSYICFTVTIYYKVIQPREPSPELSQCQCKPLNLQNHE
jgi:hypothetical protein